MEKFQKGDFVKIVDVKNSFALSSNDLGKTVKIETVGIHGCEVSFIDGDRKGQVIGIFYDRVQLEKLSKLQINDKVKILSIDNTDWSEDVIGKIGEVTSIVNDSTPYRVKIEGEKYQQWLIESQIQKVEESDKFQVGDKAILIDVSGSEEFAKKVGEEVEITYADNSTIPYQIKFKDGTRSYWCKAERLARVDTKKENEEKLLQEAEKIVRLKLSNITSENRSIQNKIDVLQQKLKDNQDNIVRLSNILNSL